MSNGIEQERLQALIDSSPLAVVEFGEDRRMRLWNPAAERIFGWSREEMIGRTDLPLAPPSKRAESEELFARVLAGGWINDYETVRQRKDGTLVDVSIAAAPVSRSIVTAAAQSAVSLAMNYPSPKTGQP